MNAQLEMVSLDTELVDSFLLKYRYTCIGLLQRSQLALYDRIRHPSGNLYKSDALRLHVSEVILRQKQNLSSYMARRVLHLILAVRIFAFAKPAEIEFPRRKAQWLANSRWHGVTDSELACREYWKYVRRASSL